MKITVLCFAQTREIAGAASLPLELPEGARIADLFAALIARYPALQAVPLRFARNQEFAGPEVALAGGDTVALIPPVAGG